MSESWGKAKRIFGEAINMAPGDRLRFLDATCAEDGDTRREVESLLASFDNAASFLEYPAVGEVAEVVGQPKKLENGKCFDHYEIISQIGAGGMGEVYLAKDKKLDRRVAIKILNEKFAAHESNLARFTQEAKAASGLNHPNILVIHEIGASEGANYIVSEYIEGRTLREILTDAAMKLPEVLDIAVQIAGALTAAHSARIVHRDIKPENIMIRPDGYVKILDFGLAKLVNPKAVGFEESTVKLNETAKGVILGTVNYMSPEQAKGEPVDARTDVFSFGVLLYEMITGRTPFAGDSMSESFANLINSEPQPLSRFASDLPDELTRIVLKTLRKSRDDRYQTMKGLLADLKTLRDDIAFGEHVVKEHTSGDKATAVLPAATDDTHSPNETARIKRLPKSLAVTALVGLLGLVSVFVYYSWQENKSVLTADGKRSLAVLPFANASQNPDAEYLSDGITESIINHLSQLSGLKVMSRNSAFRFKDDQSDTRAIASRLGVETLVTGDIKQIGDRLVINVRLIDGRDDSQIWGNQYVRTSADIITAQNEISRAVAQNLRLKLTNAEQQRLGKSYTDNVEAYQLYLKGKYHSSKLRTPETLIAVEYYQQAIAIDSNYALAYAGLAQAYMTLPLAGELSPTEFFPKAKAAAQRAVEIAPDSAEVRVLGNLAFWADWDWESAENACRRSMQLDPDNADALFSCAHVLSNTGRHPEALMLAKRSREADPLHLRIRAVEGQFLLHAGQVDEALASLQKTSELEPTFWLAHLFTSSAYIEKQMYPEAVDAANRAVQFSGGSSQAKAFGAYALGKWGKHSEARAVLAELLAASEQRYVPPYHIAQVYHGLDEREKTLEWLERAFVQRDPKMVFLKIEPKWRNLQSEPRFLELMRKMNF